MIIRIGHPAYSGDNALALFRGKAAAVRELRMRGLHRDHARKVVGDVVAKPESHTTCRPANSFSVIEIVATDRLGYDSKTKQYFYK